MNDDIEKTLAVLEEAVVGLNEVNSNLDNVKILNTQFNQKSQIAFEKISSADNKLNEISMIHKEIKNIKTDFDKQYENILTVVNNTIIPFKDELLNYKMQIDDIKAKINLLENNNVMIKNTENDSQKLKELDSFKTVNTVEKKQDKKKVIVVKKNVDNSTKLSNTNHSELREFFISKGCETIDNRSKGGALWVVGNELQLKSIHEEMKIKFGAVVGSFTSGKATNYRRAWYTIDKR